MNAGTAQDVLLIEAFDASVHDSRLVLRESFQTECDKRMFGEHVSASCIDLRCHIERVNYHFTSAQPVQVDR